MSADSRTLLACPVADVSAGSHMLAERRGVTTSGVAARVVRARTLADVVVHVQTLAVHPLHVDTLPLHMLDDELHTAGSRIAAVRIAVVRTAAVRTAAAPNGLVLAPDAESLSRLESDVLQSRRRCLTRSCLPSSLSLYVVEAVIVEQTCWPKCHIREGEVIGVRSETNNGRDPTMWPAVQGAPPCA